MKSASQVTSQLDLTYMGVWLVHWLVQGLRVESFPRMSLVSQETRQFDLATSDVLLVDWLDHRLLFHSSFLMMLASQWASQLDVASIEAWHSFSSSFHVSIVNMSRCHQRTFPMLDQLNVLSMSTVQHCKPDPHINIPTLQDAHCYTIFVRTNMSTNFKHY